MAKKKAAKKAAKKVKETELGLRRVRLLVIHNSGEHEIFEGTEHTARENAEAFITHEMWEEGTEADDIDDWSVFEIIDELEVEAENKVKVVIKYGN